MLRSWFKLAAGECPRRSGSALVCILISTLERIRVNPGCPGRTVEDGNVAL